MILQVYTVALLAVFAQSAFALTCSRLYNITQGDYCDLISQKQNVSTYQLAVLNPNLTSNGCHDLTVGVQMCLGIIGYDCQTTHVVRQDDSCDNIAAAGGLNMTILTQNNPQLDSSCDIYVGEVLCTASTVQVPLIPASGTSITINASVSTISPLKSGALSSSTVNATPVSTSATATVTAGKNDESEVSSTPASPPQYTHWQAPEHTTTAPAPSTTDDDDLPYCDEL